MRALLVVLLLAVAPGCGKKAPPEAPTDAEPPPPRFTAEMPDTADAKAFAKRLVDTTVTNWDPVSGEGAEFTFTALSFQPDGVWHADAVMKASFEEFDCKETGSWRIDEAESSDTATMEWTVVKTTCPMRESGASQRVKMTIAKGGTYKIAFR